MLKDLFLRRSSAASLKIEKQAHVFAALGDPTRLSLVIKLNDGEAHSISSLASNARITRQAISKHLSVLEKVGIVSNSKAGRESLYELNPRPLKSLQEYLEVISSQWEEALSNLKDFVENE
jgi:DNA-binding transcriptional ArsR family regulator